jgi:hypothetical protein
LLHDDFFQKFKSAKLVAYVCRYAEHIAGSPGFTVRERLMHELASRRSQQHSNTKKRKLQSISCVLPYSSRIWNRFKLQKVLKNGIIKSTLPLGSVLGKRKLVVFLKYDVASRQRICNYTAITKSTETDPGTFTCYCNTSTYSDLVDPHHKYILTCDMKLLTNGSDSMAGDFLELGTKYKDRYCPDNRPDRVILMHAIAYLRDRAIVTDRMPKEAYLHWMHEISYNYDTIINDEERDDTTVTTTITNEHKALLTASLKKLGRQFIITTTDNATGCYALICKTWYMNTIRSKLSTNTYTVCA